MWLVRGAARNWIRSWVNPRMQVQDLGVHLVARAIRFYGNFGNLKRWIHTRIFCGSQNGSHDTGGRKESVGWGSDELRKFGSCVRGAWGRRKRVSRGLH